MSANVNGPGTVGVEGAPMVKDSMVDKRYQPTLAENLLLGCAKAHRQVVYSHYEYRNYNRGSELNHGKVK